MFGGFFRRTERPTGSNKASRPSLEDDKVGTIFVTVLCTVRRAKKMLQTRISPPSPSSWKYRRPHPGISRIVTTCVYVLRIFKGEKGRNKSLDEAPFRYRPKHSIARKVFQIISSGIERPIAISLLVVGPFKASSSVYFRPGLETEREEKKWRNSQKSVVWKFPPPLSRRRHKFHFCWLGKRRRHRRKIIRHIFLSCFSKGSF